MPSSVQAGQANLESVPMRRPWGVIIAVLLLAVAVTSVLWLHQRQGPTVGGPFQLVNAATGREVSDQDFRGKWLLVFFGYTHCPDVCPTTLSNIAEAMSQLGPLAEHIQPLFITVDPERDTLPVLIDYTGAFDPRILGLSGSANQIASAAKAYQIYYAKRVIGDDYYMDHTATILVVRPDGSHSASILSTAGPTDITRKLRQLIGNNGR
jgi:protein SCO1/2|uniref:SCO family protein n=1 Tax=Mesorhizobium atlanticum TaxID=2233532 RepID=UPI003703D2B4